MIVHSKSYEAETDCFWIAYGPGIAQGRLQAGKRIETGKAILEVFGNRKSYLLRLREVEAAADLTEVVRIAEQSPSDDIGVLAYHRWQRETGGFIANSGLPVRTDAHTQNMLGNFTGQYLAGNAPETIEWKTSNGFLHLHKDEVVAIAGLVTRHVTLCFQIERDVADMIEEGHQDIEVFGPKVAFDTLYAERCVAVGIDRYIPHEG